MVRDTALRTSGLEVWRQLRSKVDELVIVSDVKSWPSSARKPSLERVARIVLPTLPVGRALAPREWATLVHVVEVFLEGAPVDVAAEKAADNIERFLVAGRSRRAWRVRVLLTAIELSSVPTHRRRFSKLRFTERQAIIDERWTTGRNIHDRLCAKVRNLAILGIYGDPRAAVATGYVPVPLRPRFRVIPDVANAASREVA
jgi:hypothetical protein